MRSCLVPPKMDLFLIILRVYLRASSSQQLAPTIMNNKAMITITVYFINKHLNYSLLKLCFGWLKKDGSFSFSHCIRSFCDIFIRIRLFIYVLIWMALSWLPLFIHFIYTWNYNGTNKFAPLLNDISLTRKTKQWSLLQLIMCMRYPMHHHLYCSSFTQFLTMIIESKRTIYENYQLISRCRNYTNYFTRLSRFR